MPGILKMFRHALLCAYLTIHEASGIRQAMVETPAVEEIPSEAAATKQQEDTPPLSYRGLIDMTSEFGSERVATLADGEIYRCCCVTLRARMVCQLYPISEASMFRLGSRCGAAYGQFYHSHVSPSVDPNITDYGRCLVPQMALPMSMLRLGYEVCNGQGVPKKAVSDGRSFNRANTQPVELPEAGTKPKRANSARERRQPVPPEAFKELLSKRKDGMAGHGRARGRSAERRAEELLLLSEHEDEEADPEGAPGDLPKGHAKGHKCMCAGDYRPASNCRLAY